MAESFDVRQLAAATAHDIVTHYRDLWLNGNNLECWLLQSGVARPNSMPGRLELTEEGAAPIALLATLRY